MSALDDISAAFPFRLKQVENKQDKIMEWKGVVDTDRAVQKEILKTVDVKVDDLGEKVTNLTRAFVGFTISLAVATVIFSFTVLTATGKL